MVFGTLCPQMAKKPLFFALFWTHAFFDRSRWPLLVSVSVFSASLVSNRPSVDGPGVIFPSPRVVSAPVSDGSGLELSGRHPIWGAGEDSEPHHPAGLQRPKPRRGRKE